MIGYTNSRDNRAESMAAKWVFHSFSGFLRMFHWRLNDDFGYV